MVSRVIASENMPKVLGPYSQAVGASGEFVFVSGQPGINAEGAVPATFEE